MPVQRKAPKAALPTNTSTAIQLTPAEQASGPYADRPTAGSSSFAVQASAASPRSPIQLKGGGGGDVHATAAAGHAGSGSALPHKAAIESSFGADMSNVQAYTGPQASAACEAMGAQAYAMGNKVAFAESSPSVQLAAHEAAHVVQQSQGVSLAGGVGQAGDKYEVAADTAAARVSSGASAADVLGTGGGAGVQHKLADGLQMKEDLQFDKPKKTVGPKAGKRLAQARDAIKHAKSVFAFGAGNQAAALKDSNFNSYFRLKVMRDPSCWEMAGSVRAIAAGNREALTAAKADLAAGGNCGEHAQVAFDYLRVTAPGETIAVSSVKGLDHAFVLMGTPGKENDNDIVVSDPWPTEATATVWEDHFAHTTDIGKINRQRPMVADGKNVKAVIAAGLKLSAKGEKMLDMKMDDEATDKKIEEDLGGWIWDHEDAAAGGADYEYVTEGE